MRISADTNISEQLRNRTTAMRHPYETLSWPVRPDGFGHRPRHHGHANLYGKAARVESAATIRAALDVGINLIEFGDFYGSGHNELLPTPMLQSTVYILALR
jgi:hypothetical protein